MSNCNPLSPKISFRILYHLSYYPQITQKILITDTCHWLELITVILGFWKYSLLEKQSLISELLFFLKVQGSNFQVQFWMNCVFPLMPIISSWEDSSCVWTAIQAGWLSPILFYTRKQSDEYWLPVKLKWGRMNVPEVVAYEWKQLKSWSPNSANSNTFQSNTRAKNNKSIWLLKVGISEVIWC